jgi:hypothetical protein
MFRINGLLVILRLGLRTHPGRKLDKHITNIIVEMQFICFMQLKKYLNIEKLQINVELYFPGSSHEDSYIKCEWS